MFYNEHLFFNKIKYSKYYKNIILFIDECLQSILNFYFRK